MDAPLDPRPIGLSSDNRIGERDITQQPS